MGKLSSFATGMGEGYIGAKRYKDSQKRMERQDAALDKIAGMEPAVAEEKLGVLDRVRGFFRRDEEPEKMANGGVVGGSSIPTPMHHDKMSWQRGSFKK